MTCKLSHTPGLFGCNIYHGIPVEEIDGEIAVEGSVGSPKTDMNWPVTPEALYWGPKFFMKDIKTDYRYRERCCP